MVEAADARAGDVDEEAVEDPAAALVGVEALLHEVPQELYYVGIEGKVKETFPVYERRGAAGIVANTRAGSTLLVVACDSSPRCRAQSPRPSCHLGGPGRSPAPARAFA